MVSWLMEQRVLEMWVGPLRRDQLVCRGPSGHKSPFHIDRLSAYGANG
jgi:hypothetical protein